METRVTNVTWSVRTESPPPFSLPHRTKRATHVCLQPDGKARSAVRRSLANAVTTLYLPGARSVWFLTPETVPGGRTERRAGQLGALATAVQ